MLFHNTNPGFSQKAWFSDIRAVDSGWSQGRVNTSSTQPLTRVAESLPPQIWFGVSAVFHYLGPSFAVLLFPAVGVFGVAWLRIASAAAMFSMWTRPIRTFTCSDASTRIRLIALGACLAFMNTSFYLALERLPMSLVAAIEFAGVLCLALYKVRSARNVGAVLLASIGVVLLIGLKWSSNPAGLLWAAVNGILFMIYIILGHRAASAGASGGTHLLGASMVIAFLFVFPIGALEASRAFADLRLVLAGIGVGVCSSVIPYVCDQLAMSRLPRATFALMLSLMPVTAAIVAAVVIAQIPTIQDIVGIILVMCGVAVHQPYVGARAH